MLGSLDISGDLLCVLKEHGGDVELGERGFAGKRLTEVKEGGTTVGMQCTRE